jgi:hypothetical protein
MKLVVIVLSDSSKVSKEFKKVQLMNLCSYGYTYFVYNKSLSDLTVPECMETQSDCVSSDTYTLPIETKYNGYSDLFFNRKETFKNIIYKTLDTFEYLHGIGLITPETIVLRTNMSSLFDYDKLHNFLLNGTCVPDMYSGPFIGSVGVTPLISGTGILIGYNKILEIKNSRHKIDYSLNEDINLQVMVSVPYKTMNIPRVDYLDDSILYHKCYRYETVFMYRFKSTDRSIDTKRMKTLITSKFDTSSLISKNSIITEEYPMYSKLFGKLSVIQ